MSDLKLKAAGRVEKNGAAAGKKAFRLTTLLLTLTVTGCAPNMFRQPKYTALSESDFFADGSAARLPVEGTVARGQLRTDSRYYTGKANDLFIGNVPVPVTRQVLNRGRERFDIYCAPCHGRLGDGDGMVVKRGLKRPPSYHIDRLREAPDGYFFDVMSSGFGAMPSYASRIETADRWAITAYIRALQASQVAKIEDIPQTERAKLLETTK
jgi:mono/diheme cytochrome c family protein